MKKPSVLFLTLVICSRCMAQDDKMEPGPASLAYHDTRQYTTRPPYGIEKVQQLIKTKTVKRQDGEDDDAGTDSLPEKIYQSLSVREKFTYNMIYGESYSQNCDGFWAVVDEDKKIFANLPMAFPNKDNYWSKRQDDFFKDNKDSVIALMTESIGRVKRVGLNYKHVMVDINATSMIPLLIATYNLQKKDHDVLTVLNLLMKKNQYPHFVGSATYTKLYANKDSYYEGALVFNSANEALIIQRATDFYNSLASK